MTTLSEIKLKLEQLKPILAEKYFVSSIGVFGSYARGDSSTASDVDILVSFKKPIGIEFIYLADFIEFNLKQKVDLVSVNGLKKIYFKAIEKEVVYV